MSTVRLLIFSVLFIANTSTFVVFAYIFGTSVGAVTSFSFLISVALTLLLTGNKIRISKFVVHFFVFQIFAPFLSVVFSLEFSFRLIMLNVFYFSIFLLSYNSFFAYGIEFFKKLFLFSLLFSVFAGFYSLYDAYSFYGFAEIADAAATLVGGRAFGFFLQPNSFAASLIYTIIAVWFLFGSERKTVNLSFIGVLALITSGSRSNIIGFSIILVFLFLYSLKVYGFNYFRIFYKKLFFPLFGLIFIVVFMLASGKDPLLYFEYDEFDKLSYRIEFLANLNEDSVENDDSMEIRLTAQKYFWLKIWENPIFGHGLDAKQRFSQSGELMGSSHNEYLKYLLIGGFVYLFFYLIFLVYLFNVGLRSYFLKKLTFSAFVFCFLVFTIFISFFTNTVFDNRVVFVVLGAMAGYYDKEVVNNIIK